MKTKCYFPGEDDWLDCEDAILESNSAGHADWHQEKIGV